MTGRDGMSDEQAKNTDTEIWRKVPDDYYSPSIHITKDGGIGMNVGGLVCVRSIEEWHGMIAELAESQQALGEIADTKAIRIELSGDKPIVPDCSGCRHFQAIARRHLKGGK